MFRRGRGVASLLEREIVLRNGKSIRVNTNNKRGKEGERKIEYASFVTTTVVRLVCRSVMPELLRPESAA